MIQRIEPVICGEMPMDYQWDYMLRSYKAAEIRDQAFEKVLQELGKLGWELMTVQKTDDARGGSFTLFFKRPLQPKTQPSSLDPGKVQYFPPQAKPSPHPSGQGELKAAPPVSESSPVGREAWSPPPKEEAKTERKGFFPILQGTLSEGEQAIKTLQKNERHGIALTRERILLVKEEAWGNPRVTCAGFPDIYEFDLRHFLGKYDFSMRFFDRKSDLERIEVLSLEEDHLKTLGEIVEYIRKELASSGHVLQIQGIMASYIPAPKE